jgi:AraC-like DNA-binding protein
MVIREPGPALRPFVRRLWAIDPDPLPRTGVTLRERVLPTGAMHVVFRLSEHPVRVFADGDGRLGRSVGHAVVGGARDSPYVRDMSRPVTSVGAELHPGASAVLLGIPAGELAHRHTPLDALWGRGADEMRERLCESRSPEARLDLFESALVERLERTRTLHPAVALALEQFGVSADVREAVRRSGYSHRRFVAVFREAVGLGPKVYCRVRRFRRLLAMVAAHPGRTWADLAHEAGYSDQSHLTREFAALAGMTPGAYRLAAPRQPHHVAVAPGGAGQFPSRRA